MRIHTEGVALILVNPRGEILVLVEEEDKPCLRKWAGMLSLPMETSKTGETDQQTLVRLLVEEVAGLKADVCPDMRRVYQIVPGVRVRLYQGTVAENELLPEEALCADDVKDHRWMRPEEFLELWLRQGAWDMVRDFLDDFPEKTLCCCRPVSETPPKQHKKAEST